MEYFIPVVRSLPSPWNKIMNIIIIVIAVFVVIFGGMLVIYIIVRVLKIKDPVYYKNNERPKDLFH